MTSDFLFPVQCTKYEVVAVGFLDLGRFGGVMASTHGIDSQADHAVGLISRASRQAATELDTGSAPVTSPYQVINPSYQSLRTFVDSTVVQLLFLSTSLFPCPPSKISHLYMNCLSPPKRLVGIRRGEYVL